MNKASLEVHGPLQPSLDMRIVDVSAFYSPAGGGVRTYVEAKFRAAPRFGHEIVVIVPGAAHKVTPQGPGGFLVEIPSPQLPVDRRYRYFDDPALLHATLDAWRPDHVEASSPWSSATMVGRWDGAATRSLVMHADPLASYAYRWFGRIAQPPVIDRWFDRFWKHLRGLGYLFDSVVCANGQLTERLSAGGVDKTRTIRMGVEPNAFSPRHRSPELRRELLAGLGLGEEAVLLTGVGRYSAEKRWDMVLRAVGECGKTNPVGMVLVGDGKKEQQLRAIARRYPNLSVDGPIRDRQRLASLLASADALVHGCESETFCLVAAEARASGLPLIVPDRGGAADQIVRGAGATYRSGSQSSLEVTIRTVIERGMDLQRAAAARSSRPRTMDEHFADLFDHYAALGRQLAPARAEQVAGAA